MWMSLEVHTAAATWHRRHRVLLLRQFGDHRLGGDEQARDRRRALQGLTHDLGRVDDALFHHVDVFAALGVEAERVVVVLEDLADDDGAVFTGIGGDLPGRSLQRLAYDVDAGFLVVVRSTHLLERLAGAQQRNAAARQHAFLDRGSRRMHRVVDAILALLDLDLGGAADAVHRNAARELGKTFLQLLAVVVGGGLLDLRLDLRDAVLDVFLLAAAVDDRGVLLVDHHLLGLAEHRQRDVLELDAKVFADRLAAGQDGDVLQHGLAAIAEAGRLYGCDFQAAAQLVDHKRGQRLALDVFGDDEERLAGLHHGLEQREQLVERGQLLLVDEDVGVLHLNAHLVGVGDEVGRDIAAVELHALDDVELGLEALGLFHRDDAFVADLFHGLGQIVADLLVAIGGDGADLGDFGVRGDLLGVLLELLDHGLDREIDAALEVHRVHAGGNRLGTFLDDRSRKHRRGRGAVTGDVGGL